MIDRSVAAKRIHGWALVGAGTAGALPIGPDAIALSAEEAVMVVHVAALFGHELSIKTAAQGLATGAFGQIVGTAIFESLNAGYPFTIPAKIAVAASVIEALGWATYDLYAIGKRLEG